MSEKKVKEATLFKEIKKDVTTYYKDFLSIRNLPDFGLQLKIKLCRALGVEPGNGDMDKKITSAIEALKNDGQRKTALDAKKILDDIKKANELLHQIPVCTNENCETI